MCMVCEIGYNSTKARRSNITDQNTTVIFMLASSSLKSKYIIHIVCIADFAGTVVCPEITKKDKKNTLWIDMLAFPELVPLFVGSYLAAKYFGLDCVMSVVCAQRSKDYTVCGLKI